MRCGSAAVYDQFTRTIHIAAQPHTRLNNSLVCIRPSVSVSPPRASASAQRLRSHTIDLAKTPTKSALKKGTQHMASESNQEGLGGVRPEGERQESMVEDEDIMPDVPSANASMCTPTAQAEGLQVREPVEPPSIEVEGPTEPQMQEPARGNEGTALNAPSVTVLGGKRQEVEMNRKESKASGQGGFLAMFRCEAAQDDPDLDIGFSTLADETMEARKPQGDVDDAKGPAEGRQGACTVDIHGDPMGDAGGGPKLARFGGSGPAPAVAMQGSMPQVPQLRGTELDTPSMEPGGTQTQATGYAGAASSTPQTTNAPHAAREDSEAKTWNRKQSKAPLYPAGPHPTQVPLPQSLLPGGLARHVQMRGSSG